MATNSERIRSVGREGLLAHMLAADDLLGVLARVLERAATELRGVSTGGSSDPSPGGDARWIDQEESPLGARLHNPAVRRRLAEGKGGARIRGRIHELTAEALQEEMLRSIKPGLRKTRGHGPTTGHATSSPPSTVQVSVTESALARFRALRDPKE